MKKIPSLLLPVLLLACGPSPEQKTMVTGTGFAMGDLPMNLTVWATDSEGKKLVQEFTARMQDLGDKMTIWDENPHSEMDRLNQSAGGKPMTLSEDSLTVIRSALKYADLSAGALDVTVGPLVKAWGIAGGQPRLPSPEEIQKDLALVNYHDLMIQGSEVSLKKPGMMVDLGSCAKGYGADVAYALLKNRGVTSALIDVGGNLFALGSKIQPDGTSVPWRVGVQDPDKPHGTYVGVVSASDLTLVTSGDYERVFEVNGKKYHHILDPKTGYPAETDVRGVTILSKNSLQADCLSTATFILGWKKGLALVESLPGVEAIFITRDKKVHLSPGARAWFHLTSPDYSLAE